MQWIRTTVTNQARAMLNKSFAEARGLMQKELKDVYWAYDELQKTIKGYTNEIERLKQQLAGQGAVIAAQKAWVHSTGMKHEKVDEELGELNGGAGGVYDEMLKHGDVVTNVIEYNSLIKIHCEETANQLLEEMKQKLKPKDPAAERRD